MISANLTSVFLFLNLSGGEVAIIFLFVLIFFGAESIPTIARSFGKIMYQIKNATDDIKNDIRVSTDNIKKDIMDHWFELYGEKFINEYPAVAKILKQRKNVDRREFARIWDETYGEDFKEKYPAMWDKLD